MSWGSKRMKRSRQQGMWDAQHESIDTSEGQRPRQPPGRYGGGRTVPRIQWARKGITMYLEFRPLKIRLSRRPRTEERPGAWVDAGSRIE